MAFQQAMIILIMMFTGIVHSHDVDDACKWDIHECTDGEVICKGNSPLNSGIIKLSAEDNQRGNCFAINDRDHGSFSNYEIQVEMLNINSKQGVQFGHLGIIFNFVDLSNFDFIYLRVHNSSSGRFQAGYVLNGQNVFDEKLQFFQPIDGTKFHRMRLVIDNDSSLSTKVFFDNNFIGSFQEYFAPRLTGGVITFPNYGNVVLFKNFKIDACDNFNEDGDCTDLDKLELLSIDHTSEDEIETKITFVRPDEQTRFSKCKSAINTSPMLTFRIQRDDSYHNSFIKYRRTDTNTEEIFTFNTGGYADHTRVEFDGNGMLTCYGNSLGHHQCNNLPVGQPVPAVIYELDINPRNGTAHADQWSRNKYTIFGRYYIEVSKCKDTLMPTTPIPDTTASITGPLPPKNGEN